MPRAFLITHRRYNATMETAVEDSSSDRTLGTAPSTPRPNDASSDDPDCLEELYNLTKLAEVSLAAAAGRLTRYRHLNATTRRDDDGVAAKDDVAPSPYGYSHKLFDRTSSRRRNDDDDDDVYKSNEESSSSCSVDSKTRLDDDCTSGDDSFAVASSAAMTTATTTSPPPSQQQQDDCHECPDCGKKYSTSSNLARHRQTHRSLADKKARRCPHCDKVYVSMPAFSMHVRTHNQGCRCHFCGKCFSRPWLLQGHIRTHTGEKPFKCSVCAKAFADKSNLRAHVQTHSNTKPHTCARCGKAFALKSYLYKHEESSCMRLHQNASRHAIRSGDVANAPTSQQQQQQAPPAPAPPPPPPPSVIVTLPRPREYFGARSAFETPSTVIRSPDRPSGSPGRPHDPDAKQRYFETTTTTHGQSAYERDTVISPNPERLIYCSVQHPSVILSGASKYGSVCQERPVDFSPATQARQFQ